MVRKQSLLVISIALALVTASGAAVGASIAGDAADARTNEQAQQGAAPTADLRFTGHSTYGSTVVVRQANLSAGGFVVIHAQDSNGPIIGVSEYLGPGSHEDVQVQLFDVPGQEFNQSRLEESQRLVASAYLDSNNNRRFDLLTGGGEQPYRQASGRPITNPAFVSVIGTAEQARANLTADVTFTSQTAFNGVATVREATLSDGGFVVIQTDNGSKEDPVGSVVGVSRYLPPGTHQDVRVELFAIPGANNTSDASNLSAPVEMVATVNLDTNDNRRFDYVATNGREDVAYLQNDGGPISNPATVRPSSSSGSATTGTSTAGAGTTTGAATTAGAGANGTTATTTATASPSPSPSATTTSGGSGGSDGGTTTEATGPGFGLVAALVAVLALALLVRRRD